MGIMRTKTVEQSIRDTEDPEFQLRKALGPVDLTLFGIGVIIGTGLFVLTGEAAAGYAGPAVALSYVVGGIACALAALCYAEFASSVPVAGSAYTFSYASLGEFVAWLIGWDLILEFTLGAATVAKGWSGYLVSVFDLVGITLPPGIYAATEGFSHDFVALIVVALVTTILVIGIKLSSQFNQVITGIKILVTLFIIGFGIFFIKASNLTPFIPPPKQPPAAAEATLQSFVLPSLLGIDTTFGITGIFTAAALVFFAYIGFDIVATTAEETKNPQRDMPIGILSSLAICTVLYVAVSLVVTGMVKYNKIEVEAPLAEAFRSVGHPGYATVISVGALVGLTTVMMILMLGQSRVFFAMSRDRLLPPVFSKVSPRFGVPVRVQITTGGAVAIIATFVPLTELAELVNIGTLFAFVLVAIGVLVLRRTRPDLERAFRTPGVPVVPILAVLAAAYLMLNLPGSTWIRFLVWMALGFVVYFVYGARHSR